MKYIKNKTLVASLLVIGIVIVTVGVTYAWFSYVKVGTKENSISSGAITFLYTEESQGIALVDAMPMTDIEGKAQTGTNNVFDFRVTSKVGAGMDIPYTVTAKIDSSSTLPAEYVKVWLTDQSNNEIEPVSVLGSLDTYTGNPASSTGEKILYQGLVPRNSSNYNKLFRLRMWMSDSIDLNSNDDGVGTYNGSTFKIKVNVYSSGVASSDEEAAAKSDASISTFTVDGDNVMQGVDDTHFTSTVIIPSDSSSATVPITVNTANPNATVTIEEVDSLGAVIKETGVKKVSVSQNYTLSKGTHYFRITIRPEDKSEPTIYYLTVTVSNPPSFATDSWATIQANVQSGNISYYEQDMANGVTRTVNLAGDPVTHYLRIANTTSCKDARAIALQDNKTLTSETACGFVIEFADIIDNQQMDNRTSRGSTLGGYPGANIMYRYINDDETGLYSKLPPELRAVLQETTVISSHDYSDICSSDCTGRDEDSNYITTDLIYLFDIYEVYGIVSGNSVNSKTRMLDYYRGKTNSNRIKVKRSSNDDINGTAKGWWLRSANSSNTTNYYYMIGSNGGYYVTNPSDSQGVSPAFRIGPLPDDAPSNNNE